MPENTIGNLVEKITPVDDDLIEIEDSETNPVSSKKVKLGNLPVGACPVVSVDGMTGAVDLTTKYLKLNQTTPQITVGRFKFPLIAGGGVTPVADFDWLGQTRYIGGATTNLTGSITTSSTSTLINGSGTSFTTELIVGDKITANSTTKVVTQIVSDTQLRVDSNFGSAGTFSATRTPALLAYDINSGVRAVTVNNEGLVSFGGNNPIYQVQVEKVATGSDVALAIINTAPAGSTGETASLRFHHKTTANYSGKIVSGRLDTYAGGSSSDSYMAFFTAINNIDTEYMRSLNGRLLIGTLTDDGVNKLQVNGNVIATGYKSSDGSPGVTGTIDLTSVTSIIVKNGLIVGSS